MTTPAGGIAEVSHPVATPLDGSSLAVRYHVDAANPTFAVPVPLRPPLDLQLDVEAREEDGVVFLNAVDIDVAVEGEHYSDAVLALLDATRSWLEYLRDEAPALGPELEPQREFVGLLDYHPATWFKRLFAE
jgi:hypothetical protein